MVSEHIEWWFQPKFQPTFSRIPEKNVYVPVPSYSEYVLRFVG